MHETLHMTHTSTCDLNDTQNDAHIIAFAVLHLCCHTGSTILCGVGGGIRPGQSSIISSQKKKEKCFMQRMDTKKKKKKKKAIPPKKKKTKRWFTLSAYLSLEQPKNRQQRTEQILESNVRFALFSHWSSPWHLNKTNSLRWCSRCASSPRPWLTAASPPCLYSRCRSEEAHLEAADSSSPLRKNVTHSF